MFSLAHRVRCYDNGGKTVDRYTVVLRRPIMSPVPRYGRFWPYIAANDYPFHPQGFGQYGELKMAPPLEWPDIGKRVRFSQLPADVQKMVKQSFFEEV